MFVAEAKIMHGWALAETGQPAIGTTQIREGLAGWLTRPRSTLYLPYFRAMLANAYGKENRPKAEGCVSSRKRSYKPNGQSGAVLKRSSIDSEETS